MSPTLSFPSSHLARVTEEEESASARSLHPALVCEGKGESASYSESQDHRVRKSGAAKTLDLRKRDQRESSATDRLRSWGRASDPPWCRERTSIAAGHRSSSKEFKRRRTQELRRPRSELRGEPRIRSPHNARTFLPCVSDLLSPASRTKEASKQVAS